MVKTIARKTKGQGQRKAKRCVTRKNQKGRKLIPLVVGSYFTHSLSNVTRMQIVKSNSNRRSRTNILANTIFLFITDVKAH
jgi:hypothetical protein